MFALCIIHNIFTDWMLIKGIFKPGQVFNKAEVNETIKKAREGQ